MDIVGADLQRRRTISEVAFVLIFLGLFVSGRLQLWLLVYVVGLVVAWFGGRWYCGWACPINTLFRGIDWVYDRAGVQRREPPSWLTHDWVRWGSLLSFVGFLVGSKLTGVQVPVLVLVTIFGVVVSLVFVESTFHRHLCPFGALLSLAGSAQRFGLEVDPDDCVGCGRCQAVCPNDTIETCADGVRDIDTTECLTCFSCSDACPVDAISYERLGTSDRR